VTEQLKILLGVGPILSAKSARWMNDNLFGVNVPDSVIKRLEESDDAKAEGDRLCAELIQTYRDMDGVAGVHIMAPAQKCTAIGRVLDLL
ncbi:MAG: methylenetetrahydrofolate reductase, partial [Pseudomonadota bacterium]